MKPAPANRLFAAVVPLIAVLLLFSTATYAAGNSATPASQGDSTVEIAFFAAKPSSRGVVLSWRTGPELDLQGFNVYRAQGAAAWEKLNPELIVATGGSAERNDYAWTDGSAKAGQSYFYRLEHVARDGKAVSQEPLRVKAGAPLRLGLDELNADTLATLWPAVLGAVVAVGGFSLVNRRRS